jgi:glutathione peroxidase-family protein
MKNTTYVLSFLLLAFFMQSSIYTIEFRKLNGGTLNMSEFANKKIIVIAFNAVDPDVQRLKLLDSLQNADNTIQVIGVPATDFSGEGNNGALNNLSNTLSARFVMSKQSQIKKETTINQHPLIKWLTHVNENSHFDVDADGADMIFLVSNTGVLYSVLPKQAPTAVLLQAINQPIN